ncbi:MAG TPA: DUF2807 domain-containing protein [Nannocystaceae bacterium]|nr:DUF2807 domain-containing protein [Nannocystaceae bacterium]
MRFDNLLRAAFLASLAAAATLASGCDTIFRGNGDAASESRDLGHFTAIDITAQIDVEIEVTGEREGPPERGPARDPVATMRCDSNLIHHVQTWVDEGVLHVHTDGRLDLRPRTTCELTLSTTTLERIRIEGPGGLIVDGAVDELRAIDIEGPAEIDVEGIAVAQLDVEVEGPADVSLAGTADAVVIDLEGPVGFDAPHLAARDLELIASGPVDADVRATESVSLDLEGPVSLDVHGHPGARDISTDGPVTLRFP